MPTGIYLTIHFALFAIMAGTAFGLWKKSALSRFQLRLILGFAILFRIILIPSTPIHESDFYRYQWDGKVAKAGINPFLFEPGALEIRENGIVIPYIDSQTGVTWRGRSFSSKEILTLEKLAALRDENPVLFERVSHKAVTTIYPPIAQAVFWTSSQLSSDSLAGLKFILVLFDIGVILCVVGILNALKRNPLGVIFYGWNPLVLKEFANSAHYDSVPIFFTVLAVYLAVKSKSQITSAAALAAGTLAKFFSILLVPILLVESPFQKEGRRFFKFIIPVAIFCALVAIGFFPHLIWDEAGLEHVFSGLKAYNAHWEYNAGLFAIFRNLLPFSSAKILSALLLISVVGILTLIPTRDKTHLAQKAGIVVGALFILSPTAFPWYFAWVLPFVCVFPKPSWLLLGALLPINYLDFHSAESLPFAHATWWGIAWLSWICWVTFATLFAVESTCFRGLKNSTNQPN
ncbi:MAG: hypothetical protein ACKVJU_22845 [Verrucomicrobiales bacterium]